MHTNKIAGDEIRRSEAENTEKPKQRINAESPFMSMVDDEAASEETISWRAAHTPISAAM